MCIHGEKNNMLFFFSFYRGDLKFMLILPGSPEMWRYLRNVNSYGENITFFFVKGFFPVCTYSTMVDLK